MKTFQKLIILVLTLMHCIFSYGQGSNLNQIAQKFNPVLQEQNKGVAVLVKKDGKIESTGIGKHSLSAQSVFNIGSATKTFTAVLILQEFENGNLKLSDSIGMYLTPIKNVDPTLSIEALLTHESGLDEVVGGNLKDILFAKNDSIYNGNLLYQIEKNSPEEFGKFNYCNTNYFLLGKILEKVSDQSYFDLIRTRIIDPLGLKHTYAYLHKNIPNLAVPYYKGEDISDYLDHRFFANIAYAAGSIASTLDDMEVFYTALYETEKLLKSNTLKLMLESGNKTYGYGVFKLTTNGDTFYGHGGNNMGYAFRNEYNPETKDLVMIFTNEKSIPSRNLIKSDLWAYLNDEPLKHFNSIEIAKFQDYTGN